jgi:hypothetical protein
MISIKNRRIRMKKLVLIGIIFSVSLFAQDSFGQLNDVFVDWVQGLALISFTIWFVGFAFSKGEILKGRFMFIGLIPLIAGGLVGIANTFFNLGGTAFSAIS